MMIRCHANRGCLTSNVEVNPVPSLRNMDSSGDSKKGQSTNRRAEDELPLQAQRIVLSHDNDIVSATRNSRYI